MDGKVTTMIDDLIECGVQVLNPVGVTAGLDAVELRRKYGRRLSFYGNIQASKMSGPLPDLEAELRRKIPLARQGGYIMHSDHSCPPEVRLARYCWLHQFAQSLFTGSA